MRVCASRATTIDEKNRVETNQAGRIDDRSCDCGMRKQTLPTSDSVDGETNSGGSDKLHGYPQYFPWLGRRFFPTAAWSAETQQQRLRRTHCRSNSIVLNVCCEAVGNFRSTREQDDSLDRLSINGRAPSREVFRFSQVQRSARA